MLPHNYHGRLSTGQALTNTEQIQVLNEALDDENIDEFSLDNDSVFNSDYTEVVTPGTHVITDRK
jgi:hypothetical protein